MSIKQDIREERDLKKRNEINQRLANIGLMLDDQDKIQLKPKDEDRGMILRDD